MTTTMLLRQALLLCLSFQLACSSQIPILTKAVNCSSDLIESGGNMATLTPTIQFHWKLLENYDLEAAVRYQGIGWVALGFSTNETMVGAQALVGVPNYNGIGDAVLYDLHSKAMDGSGVVAVAGQERAKGNVIQTGSTTTLLLETSHWQAAHYENGLYTFLVAVGEDNDLGYHKHAVRFRIDLHVCKGTGLEYADDDATAQNVSSVYDHKTAFAVHGIFATLAFGLFVPGAVASALFRSLMPKLWIYVHVVCNCTAFLFVMISVATAFGGMVMRGKAATGSSTVSHLNRVHHWMGLVLFLTVCWQVFNGFRRPPVEPKLEIKTESYDDASEESDYRSTLCCGMKRPQSPRERWQFVHRLSAICIVCLAIYQLQSGIKLFVYEYSAKQTPKGVLTVLWIWIALVFVGFVYLRCTVRRKEQHHHAPALRPGRNIMPQRDEEMTSMRGNEFNVI
ncbi:hypothetical protein MPSEU_000154900 [Mayamaea pseudoterrestris]|nr:hypothetical protein MPSEU_000154900 [Mayamaea pseudoterrestris]